ncbi:MAG: hypothetical protein EPO24_03290 [Bacteroidetes bacterium]|nr:MAG: hypothetical protein EPO24_03290 [Bacteroidota bacterium]
MWISEAKHLQGKLHTFPSLWQALAIPKRFQGKSLNDYEDNENVVSSLKKAIEENKSIFLSGGCGSGKTHLAIGLIYYWLEKFLVLRTEPSYMEESERIVPDWNKTGGVPKFVVSPELFMQLKSTFGERSEESESTIIEKYSRAPLLVLDDIGSEKVTDWSRMDLYILINKRYNAMLPTIVTSNYGRSWISENIDDRLSSRLSEMGLVINLKSTDRRVR